MPSAAELKNKGNEALSKGHVSEAINLYTEAIQLEPSNHVLFSNRSAAYCKSREFDNAYEDALSCIKINPSWGKGWQRKATALEFKGRYAEAVMAYDEGLKVDADNKTLQEGRKQAMRNASQTEKGFANMFGFPDLWEKLEKHPTTREMLRKDKEYKELIEFLQARPNDVLNHLADARIMATLQAMIQLEENGGEMPTEEEGQEEEAKKNEPETKKTTTTTTPPAKAAPETTPVIKEVTPPPAPAKSAEKAPTPPPTPADESKRLKDAGNAAYKKKEFEEALRLYESAFEKDKTNMSILSNMAAVYFEKGDLDACIAKCHEAVEVGRENRADFKLIAKALARIGNSYLKKGDNPEALKFFQKSLSEHRAPDVVKRVQQIEKSLKEAAAKAYVNPDLAEEERVKGNECFSKGEFPNAVKHYTEALKRNPDDAKIYSNRAAAYSKLMEFNLALKDCDKCVELSPDFIKGHLRKGHVCIALKNYSKAEEAFQRALAIDSTNVEAMEGYRHASRSASADPEAVRQRAMQDPEVVGILQDPAMQMILDQMQREPESAREHLRDPAVASKLKKLMESGILSMR